MLEFDPFQNEGISNFVYGPVRFYLVYDLCWLVWHGSSVGFRAMSVNYASMNYLYKRRFVALLPACFWYLLDISGAIWRPVKAVLVSLSSCDFLDAVYISDQSRKGLYITSLLLEVCQNNVLPSTIFSNS